MRRCEALTIVLLLACLPAFAQEAAKPAPAAGAVQPYDQADEKDRFLGAVGVDNELSAEEFAANAKADKPFVRAFDRWDALVRYDQNRNGKISWTEADAYRQALSEAALKAYDADGDKKLSEAEAAKLNEDLAAGRLPGAFGGRGQGRGRFTRGGEGAGRGGEGAGRGGRGFGEMDEETRKKYDADGDGQLSRDEMRKIWEDRRAEMEKRRLEQFDNDKDGQLSEEEVAAERETRRKEMQDRMDQWMTRRYDRDGDGTLNEEETAARDAAVKQMQEQRETWQKRMQEARDEFVKTHDTDGDGQLSEAERQAAGEAMRQRAREAMEKFRKEADADGNGEVSRDERREWYQKLQKKYDADGDGQLNGEERRKMMEEVGGGMFGGGRDGGRGRRGGRGGDARVIVDDQGNARGVIVEQTGEGEATIIIGG